MKSIDGMTLEELRKAISDGKYKPSEVFDGKTLVEDPFIVGHIKEAKGDEYFARKRSESEFAEKVKKLEDEKKGLETKVGELTATALKITSGGKFQAALKERKLVDDAGKPKDEKLIKFITKNYEKSFKPTDEASLKKDLDNFMDGQVDDFKELFGQPGGGATGGGGAAGGGQELPPGGGSAGAEGVDLTDPNNNPLIPK